VLEIPHNFKGGLIDVLHEKDKNNKDAFNVSFNLKNLY